MITQVKMPFFSNSLNSFFKEIYGEQFGEFVCGYWGLKGEVNNGLYVTKKNNSHNDCHRNKTNRIFYKNIFRSIDRSLRSTRCMP